MKKEIVKSGFDVLSARERQVVELIRKNKKYREIAVILGIGEASVKTFAARIRKKTKTDSKVGIMVWYEYHSKDEAK